MKIAILQDDFPPHHIGGAGAVAFASAKELQKRGHEVIVITTDRKAESAGVSEFEGLKVHTIASDYDFRFQAYVSLWNPSVVKQVRAILAAFRPDVVHAHRVHGYLSYGALVVAKQLGARVILTSHDVMPFNYGKLVETIDATDYSVSPMRYRVSAWRQMRDSKFRYNPIRNMVIRYILKRYVDTVLAVSTALKDALEENRIGNVEVVHNGIDARDLDDSLLDMFKKAHSIGSSAVFFTGKPVSVKGGLKLVEALAIVAQDKPDVQLLVVGRNDNQMARLLEHARNHRLEKNIIVTGWLSGDELAAAYAASAVVAVPTLSFDSFPTVNLEAMAAKKPVIATCFGGSPEAVEDGKTGYIVNPLDVASLAAKLRELLLDPQKAMQMGEKGYERVTTVFTLEQQAKSYERYY